MLKDWELHGSVTRTLSGVNDKTRQPYQMLQVGGHSFFLDPEWFDDYREGEEVVISATFVRDVRGQSGRYEAVHVITGINRLSSPAIPRADHQNGTMPPKVEKGQPA